MSTNTHSTSSGQVCPNCGQVVREGARFCSGCGFQLPSTPAENAVAARPTRALKSTGAAQPLHTSAPIRRDQNAQRKTIPLQGASTAFASLPEDAWLPTEAPRYRILETRNSSPKLNVYLVETIHPVSLCQNPDCPRYEIDGDGGFCSECGVKGSEPITLRYLLKESANAAIFASSAQIQQLELTHPGLLLFKQFQQTLYSKTSPRYYQLEPEPGPILASSLSVPQEPPRVLDWGAQLANALAHLHNHKLVWQTLTTHHVAIEDKRARWANFNTRLAQSPADYQRDVQRLAAILFTMSTGLPNYTIQHQLPEPAGRAFEQTLGKNPAVVTAQDLEKALTTALNEIRRPASVQLTSHAQTDVGSVRDHNEDNVLAQEMVWSNLGFSRPLGLYVVADGMGGHSAGEVASGLVINTLLQKMATEIMAVQANADAARNIDFSAWMREAITAANAIVFKQAKETRNDMGTTVVAALMLGDTAYIGHVGDSRAYLVNAEGIRPLTTDHSLVERLIATKQITREEAHNHPQSNVIYRTIGDKARVEVDVGVHRFSPGEKLLLCSDGLNGMLLDDEIWRIVNDSPSLKEAARRLINAANTAGGDDNISVIIVQVDADGS